MPDQASAVQVSKGKVNCKIYYSTLKNCAIHLEEEFHGERIPGKTFVPVYTLYFREGRLETSKQHEIEQLDGMIRTKSPLIRSKNEWILRDANEEEQRIQLAPPPSQLDNQLVNTGAGGAINTGQTLIVETNQGQKNAAVVQAVQEVDEADHVNGIGTMPVESSAAMLPVDVQTALRAGIQAAAAGNAAGNSGNQAIQAAIAKLQSQKA